MPTSPLPAIKDLPPKKMSAHILITTSLQIDPSTVLKFYAPKEFAKRESVTVYILPNSHGRGKGSGVHLLLTSMSCLILTWSILIILCEPFTTWAEGQDVEWVCFGLNVLLLTNAATFNFSWQPVPGICLADLWTERLSSPPLLSIPLPCRMHPIWQAIGPLPCPTAAGFHVIRCGLSTALPNTSCTHYK